MLKQFLREPLGYHEATKHHFKRYARSTGYMDWANQPNPFRVYEGADVVALPLPGDPLGDIAYAQLYTPCGPPSQPLSIDTVGSFLALSLGLSAWKAAGGSRWSLRINPSSGNLHPTEAYLILAQAGEALSAGLYHYNVFQHALERRSGLPLGAWTSLEAHFQGPGFLVALSSIFWRESWKYGERAFRYCQLDVGHALAALAYAARLNGWRFTCLNGAGDSQIAALLGLDRTPFEPREAESPDLIGWVSTGVRPPPIAQTLPDPLVTDFTCLPLSGQPNRLSRQTVDWAIIYQAEDSTRKPATPPSTPPSIGRLPDDPVRFLPPIAPRAAEVIHRRRSATAFDPGKSCTNGAFFSILDRTRARANVPPFDVALISPMVDLLLFVHRVTDVASGLYFLVRSGRKIEDFKSMFHADFLWRPIHPDLPLWQLTCSDVTYEAMETSCHQQIAGQSAFAVAMIASLKPTVTEKPYLYRHLHWECGMIGQALYLEAEAQGVRGTGIGCFFDDAVTELLGAETNSLNSLYHFTVGYPVEDPRIQTLPAYHHLVR